jgi:outer membrane protein
MKNNPLTRPGCGRAVAVLVMGALMLVSVQAQNKIGIIDLEKVFDNYWKRKQADALLKERQADFAKVRKQMLEDYENANEEYNKLKESAADQAVSTDERDRRKNAMEKKLVEIKGIERDINLHDRNANDQLVAQMRRMREKILDEVRELINVRAKAGGYALVLDTAAKTVNQTPVLLYTNGQNDLTEEILAELNANAPTGALKSDEPEDKPTRGEGEKKADKGEKKEK